MKIAVWGLGKHAIKNILPAIEQLKDVELEGVLTRNQQVCERVAKEFNCKSWNNPKEMLSEDIDVVYLATPPGLHYEQGSQILNSGKHFWCEKPLTLDLNEALDLAKISKESGLTVCEGYMHLYHPQYIRIKDFLTKNLSGEVQSIKMDFGLPEISSPGYRNNLELGGSCFLDVGSYLLSVISDCFDFNKINIDYLHVIKDEKTGVDVSGSAHLTIESTINCSLEWSYSTSYKNDISIWAKKGTVYSNKIFSKDSSYEPSIYTRDINGKSTSESISASNHFILMLKSFVENTRNPKEREKEVERFTNLAFLIQNFRKASNF